MWTLAAAKNVISASNVTQSLNGPSNSHIAFLTHIFIYLFIFISWSGMRVSPFGTSATNLPNVAAPDDRWWRMWNSRWNESWQRKPKYSEETCYSATLSTANPTWPDVGSNPGRRGGKSATNRLSYGTACISCPHNLVVIGTLTFKWTVIIQSELQERMVLVESQFI
jgi:hypothetical protein